MESLQLILVAFCMLISSTIIDGLEEPILKIPQGLLKGAMGRSRGGRSYYKFMGIPYGDVKERFADSILASPWKGIRNASDFGEQCLQRMLGGEEDCLHINVYTPQLPAGKPDKKFPVLFFIHGGGFILGSGNVYGADYFMDEDCVLVTINYRLGVFGFLNLGTDEAPGNQGLKDQVLALRWVQEFIGEFNGDKNRVMIFGESAGAVSVSLLILSSLTKGLFHAAISQSGTAHPECPFGFNANGLAHGKALAAELKCGRSSQEMVKCLRKMEAQHIFKGYPGGVIPKPGEGPRGILNELSFIPSVESRPPSDKSQIFLQKPAIDIFKEGSFQNVPWIIGVNEWEGFLFTSKFPHPPINNAEELNLFWAQIGPQLLFLHGRPDKNEIMDNTKKFYFEGRLDIQENLTNSCTDRMFLSSTKLAAEFHSLKSPTYLYFFEKRGGFGLMTALMRGVPSPRPTHGDELTYQFKFNADYLGGAGDIGKDHEGFGFSEDFVKMWVHFAETGTPRGEWNSKKITWEPLKVKGEGAKWLHLNTDAELKVEDPGIQKRLKFLRDLNL